MVWLVWVWVSVVVGTTVFNVKDYGAKGDGKTVDTNAIRKTLLAAQSAGGGEVFFPPGKFLTAPFNLSSHITLEVGKGGTVLGLQDKEGYPIIPPLVTYGTSRDGGKPLRYQALIMATQAQNVKIIGEGTIDGQGKYWWDARSHLKWGRPRLVEFLNCSDVEVTGVTLRNPGFWTLHPIYCTDVWIHDMTISNDESSPNTDGVDPDSSTNVVVERTSITCGDDFIAIKSGLDGPGLRWNLPCRNITIRNNHFGHGHGISIGSETSGGIDGVYVYNNTIVGPAKHGLNIKTAPARGNVIQNVIFDQNILGGVEGPCLNLGMNYDKAPPAPHLPVVRNIQYHHVSGSSCKQAGSFECLEKSPCHGIVVEDVQLSNSHSTWSCSHVLNATVKNVSPSGLSDCMKKS